MRALFGLLGILLVHGSVDFTSERLQVGDISLNVGFVNKESNGPIFMFLHGFPEGWYSWAAVAEDLAKLIPAAKLVMPDQRGYNMSDKPADLDAYHIDHLVKDVVSLIQIVAGPNGHVHLVAHDWGGVVAWAVASLHPESIDTLTIMNAPHPDVFFDLLKTDAEQQKRSQYIIYFHSEMAAPELVANDASALVESFSDSSWWTPELQEIYVKAWTRPGAVNAGLNWYRRNMILDGDTFEGMTTTFPSNLQVSVPTLVCWGMNDTAFHNEPNLASLPHYVSDLTVKRFPGVSHFIEHAIPSEIASAVYTFAVDHTSSPQEPDSAKITTKTLQVGDLSMNVGFVNEEGTGPVVVFLHGFPEGWYSWADVATDLSRRMPEAKLVMPDQRGYNMTEKPAGLEAYHFDYLVSDVVNLIHAVAGPNGHAHLVAHDWGGIVAWAVASLHPEVVDTLTIMNAPHPNVFVSLLAGNAEQQKRSQYILQFVKEEASAFLTPAVLATFFSESSFWTPQLAAAYNTAWTQPGAVNAGLNWYRENILVSGDSFEGISSTFPRNLQVTVPTLVCWGMNDTAFNNEENLAALSDYVPDLTVKRFPNVSHWIGHTIPSKLASEVHTFILANTMVGGTAVPSEARNNAAFPIAIVSAIAMLVLVVAVVVLLSRGK